MPELFADLPATAILMPAALVYFLWALFHWIFRSNEHEKQHLDQFQSELPTDQTASTASRALTPEQATYSRRNALARDWALLDPNDPTLISDFKGSAYSADRNTNTDQQLANKDSESLPESADAGLPGKQAPQTAQHLQATAESVASVASTDLVPDAPVSNDAAATSSPEAGNVTAVVDTAIQRTDHSSKTVSADSELATVPDVATDQPGSAAVIDVASIDNVASTGNKLPSTESESEPQPASNLKPVLREASTQINEKLPQDNGSSADLTTNENTKPAPAPYKTAAKFKSAAPTAEVTLQLKTTAKPTENQPNLNNTTAVNAEQTAKIAKQQASLDAKDAQIESLKAKLAALEISAEQATDSIAISDNPLSQTDHLQHEETVSKLAIAGLKVEQLRATVNTLQAAGLNAELAKSAESNSTHNRPSLLSKVRLVSTPTSTSL